MSAALQLTYLWATEVIHQQRPSSREAELRTNRKVESAFSGSESWIGS